MTRRSANFDGGLVPSAEFEFFEGDLFDPDEAKPSSPEVNLWLAVAERTWSDAFESSDHWLFNSDRTCDPDMIRADARRWLVHDFGDWKEDREDVCTMAGIDPNMIHAAAVKRLELARVEDVARRRIEITAIDTAFENLLAREGELTKPQISVAIRHLAIREARL